MSFSAKRCAYCPRPSFSSQSAICCIAAASRIVGLHSARAGDFIREAHDAVGQDIPTSRALTRGADRLRGTFQREFCLTATPALRRHHAPDRGGYYPSKDLRAETTLAAPPTTWPVLLRASRSGYPVPRTAPSRRSAPASPTRGPTMVGDRSNAQFTQNGFDGSKRSSRRLNPISRKIVSSRLSNSCRERSCCHQSARTWFNPPRCAR